MFGSNVAVFKERRFLGGVSQHVLALPAQRQVNGGRILVSNRCSRFYLLADRSCGAMRASQDLGDRLILAEQPEQEEVFRLNERTPKLAGLIAGEEDRPPGLFGVAFKHRVSLVRPIIVQTGRREGVCKNQRLVSRPPSTM